MADKPKRPKVSTERTRVVSRPVNRQKAKKLEEKRHKQEQYRVAQPTREKSSFSQQTPPTARTRSSAQPPRQEPSPRLERSASVNRPSMEQDEMPRQTRKQKAAPEVSISSRRSTERASSSRLPMAEPPQYRVIRGGAGRRRAGLVALVSAVAVLLATVVLINSLAPAGLIELIETSTAGFGTGEGFPQSIGSTTDQSIAMVGGSTAVLTDTSLILYKSDGYKVFERQHGYSTPVLSTSTSRMLVYDRGSTKLRVENAARSLGEMTMENGIITADLGYDGTFAVATHSNEHLCDVEIYNADLEKIYTWHSATRYVASVSMADGGRYFAVGVISVEAGECVSHVIYFDCRSVEPIYTQEFRGSTLLSVDCKSGGRVVAVFDDMLSSLNRNGQRTDFSLEGQTLQAFDNHDRSGVAVSLTKYNQPQDAELMLFDASLKECGGGQTEGIVQSISMSSKRVCVLLRDRMVVFNNKGNLLGKVEVDSDSLLVANTNRRASVVGTATVGQYDIAHFAAVKSQDTGE